MSAHAALPAILRTFKNPAGLTRIVQVLLVLGILATVAASGFSAWSIGLAGQVESLAQYEVALPVSYIVSNIGFILGWILLYTTTVVFFCIWIHRTCSNAWALNAQPLDYTPAWSVGWYFIPIMNVWKPFQAMCETWKASEASEGHTEDRSAAPIVAWWWTCGLLAAAVTRAATRMNFNAEALDQLVASEYLSIGSDLLNVAFHIAAFLLVTRLAAIQIQRTGQSPATATAPYPQPAILAVQTAPYTT